MNKFNDLAIILTWPDTTIRGDEEWLTFLKKIGVVKNLNFKIGHTGIVLVNPKDGSLLFYDFGRYVTPRGFGRARSKQSDPLLKIDSKAEIVNNKITNIEAIISALEQLKSAMYGEGKLYFSIVEGINFKLAKIYGDNSVLQGARSYGAIAKNSNNCSRFITRMLMKSSKKFHFLHPINLPETIKSSPMSNLINTASDRKIYSYTPAEGLIKFKMDRFQSIWFHLKQVGNNIIKDKALLLPNDQHVGAMKFDSKPISIPTKATYLGGVGDGAWYYISPLEKKQFIIKRYTTKGQLEYIALGEASQNIDINKKFEITYDSHMLFTNIIQNDIKIQIIHIERIQESNLEQANSRLAVYA